MLFVLFAILSLSSKAEKLHVSLDQPICNTTVCIQHAQFIRENLASNAVDPCEDFHTFSCGGWQKKHPLSPVQSSKSAHYMTIKLAVLG